MAKAQEMYLKITLIIEKAHLYSAFPSPLLSLSLMLHSTQPTLPSAIALTAPATFLSIAYGFLCNTERENTSTLAQTILSFGKIFSLSFKASTVTLQQLSRDNGKEHLIHAWGRGLLYPHTCLFLQEFTSSSACGHPLCTGALKAVPPLAPTLPVSGEQIPPSIYFRVLCCCTSR